MPEGERRAACPRAGVGGKADVQQTEQGGEVVNVGARRKGEHLGGDGCQQPEDAAVSRRCPSFTEEEPVHFQEGKVPSGDEHPDAPHVDVPATRGGDHRDEAPEPAGAPEPPVSLVVVEDHTAKTPE